MEKNRLILNSPTTAELGVLKHFLPQIKAKAENAASEPAKAQKQILRGYCGICGEGLRQSNRSRENQNLCNECQGYLTDGQTALVTMDGRYAFVKSDGSDEAKAIAGKIIPVEAKLLDEMAQKQGIEIKENPNAENN